MTASNRYGKHTCICLTGTKINTKGVRPTPCLFVNIKGMFPGYLEQLNFVNMDLPNILYVCILFIHNFNLYS